MLIFILFGFLSAGCGSDSTIFGPFDGEEITDGYFGEWAGDDDADGGMDGDAADLEGDGGDDYQDGDHARW